MAHKGMHISSLFSSPNTLDHVLYPYAGGYDVANKCSTIIIIALAC